MNDHEMSSVSHHFNRAADRYDDYAIMQKMVAERLLERLDLVRIQPELVIDIGSGTGHAALKLGERYRRSRILELDISPEMLRVSRRKTTRWFSRRKHIAASAESIPIRSHVAQLVFSSLAYQWCNNLDQAFAEVKRVLAPGGLLMFSTAGPDTLKELRECWSCADSEQHVNRFFDMHDIGDALVRAGMSGVVMDVEMITLSYQDCLQLMRDLKYTGANNASFSRNKNLTGKRKLEQVIQAYEKFRNPEGLPATYEIVYGHAWSDNNIKTAQKNSDLSYFPLEKLKSRLIKK